MTNYTVFEGTNNSVYKEFKTNKKIIIGDTIEYISNNQMGYEKYKVVIKNGVKCLELLQNYYSMYEEIKETGETEN